MLEYGLRSLIDGITSAMLLLLIGFVVHRTDMTLIYLVFSCCVAEKLGGYHASTRVRCLIITIVFYMAVLYLPELLVNKISRETVIVLCVIFFLVIWKIAPVEHPNKILDDHVRHTNRVWSRWLAVGIICLIIIFQYVKVEMAYILFVNMLEVVISMLIGKVVNMLYEKRNRTRFNKSG